MRLWALIVMVVAGSASAGASSKTGPSAPSAPGVDASVNPCDDFYRYACGPWMAQNPVPPDQPRWGRFDELYERNQGTLRGILEKASSEPAGNGIDRTLGDFYGACMDERASDELDASPIHPDLGAIEALGSKADLPQLVARLARAGDGIFAAIGSGPDFKDPKVTIAQLDQGGLGLPDRDAYLKDDPHSKGLRQKYLAHIEKMFRLLGDSPEAAAAAAARVMSVETSLARASLDPVARRNPEARYHKMALAELEQLSPSFSWSKYFQAAGAPSLDSLNVAVPDFVRGMESVVQGETLPAIRTYLRWHVVSDRSGLLSRRFIEEHFDFYGKTLTGALQIQPRWKRCVRATDASLGDALGQRFVELSFGAVGKERTSAMVAALEKALARDIAGLEWMTAATKARALEKLHGITNKIGYPERWQDYSTLRIEKRDFAGDVARANAFRLSRDLAKIGKPTDKGEWDMTPPTVNADYDPRHNDISFPAGLLQQPLFDASRDDAMNFGALGATIGHELTHGFDDEGRKFGADGTLSDWWTERDAKEFQRRAQCLVDEYSRLTAVGDVKVNGELTLGENTADHGGLRVSLMALEDSRGGGGEKKDQTPEQRFFVGWAQIWCENRRDELSRLRAAVDPHAPPRLRVNVPLSDMPEFQSAFSCRGDAPMVRQDRCQVW